MCIIHNDIHVYIYMNKIFLDPNVQDDRDTGKNPLLMGVFGLHLGGEDEIRTTHCCRVAGAFILVFEILRNIFLELGFAPHDRQCGEHLLGSRLFDLTRGHVPSSTFEKHTADEIRFLCMCINLFLRLLGHLGGQAELVQFLVVLLTFDLFDGGQEGRRVKELGNVDDLDNCRAIGREQGKLRATLLDVGLPRHERAKRRKTEGRPRGRKLLCEQTIRELLHQVGHCELTLEAKLQLSQRTLHLAKELLHVRTL